VLYTIEGQGGSNLYIQYLAVFAQKNGKLTPLTHADVGGKSTRGVELTSVANNSILLNTLSYGPKDASCCPSIKGTTRYMLSGSKLFEQKRGKSTPRHLAKQFPVFSPHGQMRAFDFQVKQGEKIIAGTNTATIKDVWDQQGWTEKLCKE